MSAPQPSTGAIPAELEVALASSASAARSELVRDLHSIFRRLRQYGSEQEWARIFVEGVSLFANISALFAVRGDTFFLLDQTGLMLPDEHSFGKSTALAFQSAIASSETVIALRTKSEVGPLLATADQQSQAVLLPVSNTERVAAVLFAASDKSPDVEGLELLASLASSVLSKSKALLQPVAIATIETNKKQPQRLPTWTTASPDESALHLRARRFARVRVAEMQLAKPEAWRSGREQNNLFLFLGAEINSARDLYQKQFMTVPSMADYLHQELVQNGSDGDERKLGPDYPGQLV